jgi:hypothetical protein
MMGRLRATGGDGRAPLASLAMALVLGSAAASCTGDGANTGDDGGLDAGDGSPSEMQNPADTHETLDASKNVDGPRALLSSTSLVFPPVSCGSARAERLTVANRGSSTLKISASIAGSAFSVSPAVFQVAPGKSGALTVLATVPGSATSGVPVVGVLTLYTNDPTQKNVVIGLSATPTGPTLAILPDLAFAFSPRAIGNPAPPLTLTLSNTGNAPGTFTFGAPGSPFSLSLDGPDGEPLAVTEQTTVTLKAGATWSATAGFTPPSTILMTAMSNITTTGATCGASDAFLYFSGQGAVASVTGWPATIDFGPAVCGGAAPANQTFTLTNSGVVDAEMTMVSLTGAPGFSTDAKVRRAIFAEGNCITTVTAPPVPVNSPLTSITATLTIETDADSSMHVITLTEEPSGAILAFDTSPTPNFGSFGSIMLLESATQYFEVVNNGSAPATVTLAASANGPTGAPSPFSISPSVFTIGPGAAQTVSATFTPLVVRAVTGGITMTTASGSICGTLPEPIPLSGSGLGGGPTITPSSLSFPATCGGAAPGAQSFIVRNDGTANLTWSMSGPTGAGASQYSLTADPTPGILIPGAFATVNVAAQAIPSPAPNATPAAFAAQVRITTDVPLDTPHVVSLGETPLGDQLSFSTPTPLRFGEISIDTTVSQTFTIANNANAGSPPANVSFSVGGTGAAGYSVPPPVTGMTPGATSSEGINFSPTSAARYTATLAALTADALCTPIPPPLTLTGAGM